MKRNAIWMILVGIMAVACSNPLEGEIKQKYEVLLKNHDEVMPKTMKLAKIKGDMLKSVESLSETDSLKMMAVSTAQKLDLADEKMYTWMDDFGKVLNEEKDLKVKSQKYDSLLVSIAEIAKLTDKAMADANQLILNNKK